MLVRSRQGRYGLACLALIFLVPLATRAAENERPAEVLARQIELQQQMSTWLEATLRGIAAPYRVVVTVQLTVRGEVRDIVSKEESQPGTEMKMGSRREMKLPGLPLLDKPLTGVGSPDLSFKVPGRTTREIRKELGAIVERTAVRVFIEKGMAPEQLERIKQTTIELAGLSMERGDTIDIAELSPPAPPPIAPLVQRDLLLACGTFLLAALMVALGLARRGGASPTPISVEAGRTGAGDGAEADEAVGETSAGPALPGAPGPVRPRAFASLAGASHAELLEVLAQFGPRPSAALIDLLPVPPEVVRELLGKLPAERRLALAVVLGRGEVVPLSEIAALEHAAQGALDKARSKVAIGGAAQLADLLSAAPEETQHELLEALGKSDAALAKAVRSKMLLFEDLATLPVESIRQVVASCDPGTTAMALHGVPAPLRAAVMGAVSKRLKGILTAEAEGLEGKPATEIETARKAVERAMRRLQGQGRIARAA
ncbi:MAG: FliG C-terminal domain-containing protein [Myxococcaceae bacterium]